MFVQTTIYHLECSGVSTKHCEKKCVPCVQAMTDEFIKTNYMDQLILRNKSQLWEIKSDAPKNLEFQGTILFSMSHP